LNILISHHQKILIHLMMELWILVVSNKLGIENQPEIQEQEKKYILNYWRLEFKNYRMKITN